MRARTALLVFAAMSLAFALIVAPEVILVPAFLIGLYILVRPRRSWRGGRR
ncbi:hypothetical protein [Nocardia huaxiensis]|uniref:Uncharacterized protein n=1 Tax=Nocardia huaxiensis TaxID=2755382 RepID=A0A7D6ZU60_9NOCA|nr:hypothetical protein [Nocardia huaxiensis]QLY33985.1 hypothetical protein H0264_18675 [Nocardia huaxiensis]UFS99112.1 hypothetical protein LPY97_15035 [Nocardia huaxiensis]